MDGSVFGWFVVAAFIALSIVGLLLLLRSINRWKLEEPRTPETRAAMARLWSTRLGEQR